MKAAPFEVTQMPQSSVLYLYSIRDKIDLDPAYQREGEIWSLFKKQLLIDSLLNGFDIPKIYFHDTGPAGSKRYAVIDGKQRLQAIWGFLDDDFPLSDDFILYGNSDVSIAGLKYSEISKKLPSLKIRLDATSLSVFRVEAADLEFIEEMFSRLNEAVPLSSAEKRRTGGGAASRMISELASHEFFIRSISFRDHRARYFDVASKIAYLEAVGAVADTKREFLDGFVRRAKNEEKARAQLEDAIDRARVVLDTMTSVFEASDPLLKQVGLIPVYYWLFRACLEIGAEGELTRRKFQAFEEKRHSAKQGWAGELDFDMSAISQFNRLSQTPNDTYAIEFRVAVLVDQVLPLKWKEEVLKNAGRMAFMASDFRQ
ncbi:DUF262 domain-containing protein [Thermomonas fusca]|uniref:DUF262 domain-containing protein n=1 Tax=Thermomonas fusca TaxID=215690 RepID=A0A5R9PFB9_9GAMM|nr:DUF262 domain-containing protein [Thermomonas fusca]TLX22209.1 DUF262 domain-containing protein [Thermomonas fusca]